MYLTASLAVALSVQECQTTVRKKLRKNWVLISE